MTRPRLATLIFEVTRRCNHNCQHCYNFWAQPGYRDTSGPLPEGDLRPLLEHTLAQVDCDLVTLTGGEPLLRPDLPEVVSFLAERNKRVNLILCGRKVKFEKFRKLFRCLIRSCFRTDQQRSIHQKFPEFFLGNGINAL